MITHNSILRSAIKVNLIGTTWIGPHSSTGIAANVIPANTKHLYNFCRTLDQRRRRWADVVQMLYKCFLFAEMFVQLITPKKTVTAACASLLIRQVHTKKLTNSTSLIVLK